MEKLKMDKILFFDYSVLNNKLKDQINENLSNLLSLKSSKEYNELVTRFEKKFAEYCECNHCIGLNSGTSALQLALTALGVKKGDEVIVPAYTYAASAIVISNLGAKPVFTDVLESDLTIDSRQIEDKITEKTKAIIAVHIHGNPCNMQPILNICKKYNLHLIEDSSQAHGARYDGKRVGSFGIGCFSLHMSKSMGGIGNTGAMTLNNPDLKQKIMNYIDPDNNTKEVLFSLRTPCDMDAIHTCFLLPKIEILDKLNDRKREMADLYNKYLKNSPFTKPTLNDKAEGVYRDYYIVGKNRKHIMEFLLSKGIETKARYKIALHLTKTFEYLGHKKGDFPNAERAAEELICLPTHIGISDEDIKYICSVINEIK